MASPLPIRRGWLGGPPGLRVIETSMSVVTVLISIVTIGVLAYAALDCLIPKDPPDGGQHSDS